jgi:hypothetical protein
MPSVDYKYIRAGADGRMPFGPAAVFFGVGYMNIMSSGKFADTFPHVTMGGLDAKVGGSYALMPWLEAKATFVYTRIFASFHPTDDDARSGVLPIAGGALDQYFVPSLALAGIF